jgi:signal transduction histidine kinase
VRTTSNTDCRFAGAPSIKVQDDVAAQHLYRIAQEAVHNALRHGKPRSILIHLDSDDRGLILTITDDGTGMREARERSGGLGMHIMHYRAGIIGGQITVEPGPDGGTRVRCLVPAPR